MECRSLRSVSDLFNDGAIDGSSPVRSLPYISTFFGGRLNALGIVTLADLLSVFISVPPLPAVEIDKRIAVLTQNPRRNQCVQGDDDKVYHVSDSNQCCYNSILSFLRRCHNRRANWQQFAFHGPTNVANAVNVPFRSRGHSSTKNCSCLPADDCTGLCRYHPNAEGGPVCVPRFGPGFEGVGDFAGQRVNGGLGLRNIDGMTYSRRWRKASPASARPLRLPFPQPNVAAQQQAAQAAAQQQQQQAAQAAAQQQAQVAAQAAAQQAAQQQQQQPIGRRTRSRTPIGGPSRRTRSATKKRRRHNRKLRRARA